MQLTNNFNLPSAIVNAVKGFEHDYKTGRKDTAFSVTELISPPLIARLKKEHFDEIKEDVSDRIWVLIGSAVHSVLEHSAKSNDLVEERLFTEVQGIRISGQADHYDTDGKILSDYKITSVWSVLNGSKPEWEAQLNILAYLYEGAGFPVEKLQVVAILRDWTESRVDGGNYPSIPVKVVDVPRWTKERTETYITARVALHLQATCEECSKEERWESDTVFAQMKKGRKSAVKLHDTEEEANKACTERDHYVEVRPGRRTRCERYCSVSQFCSYYQDVVKSK